MKPQKNNLDATTVIPLLVEHPAMIKRPILARDGQLYLGFKADQYQSIFL
jgi:arsenate reductase-like glutaredoxin family protein